MTSYRWLVAVGLALVACTGRPEIPVRDQITIDETIAPQLSHGPQAPPEAWKIARRIDRKYLRVQVWGVSAKGDLVAYVVRMRLDSRSEHPDYDDWAAHVRHAARDQRQAAVEILKRTIRRMPEARLVSVFQDDFLQPRWSRAQIEAMDEPESYRDFEAWQDLVLSAVVLPGFVSG